jgi:nucleoside-diphosphate-sugar epimerase
MDEIWNLPLDRLHVAVERDIVAKAEQDDVRVVILAPGLIFHTGVGVGKKDSYTNEQARVSLDHGRTFMIGEGENVWSWVSVDDLGAAVGLVITESLDPRSKLEYGKEGYYYCGTGTLTTKEQMQVLGAGLKKLGAIATEEVEKVTVERAAKLHEYGVLLWGASMKFQADKLRALGWSPRIVDWRDLVENVGRLEHETRRARENRRV